MKPRWLTVAHLIVAGMLLWALHRGNPYNYYEVLRWVVFGYFLFIASLLHEAGERRVFWAVLIASLIYNPFVRPKWGREVWNVVNVATLVPLGLCVRALKAKADDSPGT